MCALFSVARVIHVGQAAGLTGAFTVDELLGDAS
jgi:hypothetical protein